MKIRMIILHYFPKYYTFHHNSMKFSNLFAHQSALVLASCPILVNLRRKLFGKSRISSFKGFPRHAGNIIKFPRYVQCLVSSTSCNFAM
ncbi:hypothetical protein EYC80_007479 [Monilinia laxa]|uniref:Uncharacterized protein n=1 Tax=Monilinia laxa TaxID=61186 RepID=A0A5N6JW06_MONLA|nr:hypothetical protein EYC80_007479 [Monilinia laxa]